MARQRFVAQRLDPPDNPMCGGTRNRTLPVHTTAKAANPVAAHFPPERVGDGLGGAPGDGEPPAMQFRDEFCHGHRPEELENPGQYIAKVSAAQQKWRHRFVHGDTLTHTADKIWLSRAGGRLSRGGGHQGRWFFSARDANRGLPARDAHRGLPAREAHRVPYPP